VTVVCHGVASILNARSENEEYLNPGR